MQEQWCQMVVRCASPEELASLCQADGVVTLASESAEAYIAGHLGLSRKLSKSGQDSGIYFKQELLNDIDLLRRLRDTRASHAVVGIGSGWLCDIAKIVGYKGTTVLVPSALTTNGPFTHKAVADESLMALVESRFEPGKHSVVTGYPDELLICHDLLQRPGNARFNRAGLGDPLASITGICDNALADRAITDPVERERCQADLHPEVNAEARATVERLRGYTDDVRNNTRAGIDLIVDALKASARWHYLAPRVINGGEHSFAEKAEVVLQRKGKLALHGELLGLGILCILEVQGRSDEVDPTRTLLSSLGLPTHYAALELTRAEVVAALRSAAACRPDKYGILNEIRDPSILDRAVDTVFDSIPAPV